MTAARICMYVCMYVSNILLRICRTLVPKICVHPGILRVFWHIDVLTSVIYNCTQQGLTGATCVCHEDYRQRQVGECADT